MCFSISMAKSAEEIVKVFGIYAAGIPEIPAYYHVSGFSYPEVPVLYSRDGEKVLDLMIWGLIPEWVRSSDEADRIRSKTLNARGETADTLPSFRSSFRSKRCVVIADGFYEPHYENGNSFPWYIRRKDRGILPLGGLYTEADYSGRRIMTFSIITIPASPMIAEIHNRKKRMPLILPDGNDSVGKWIDPEFPEELIKSLFIPPGDEILEGYQVSGDIYRKEINDSPELQIPLRHYNKGEEGDFLPF